MKRDLMRLVGNIILGGVVILAALTACSGSTGGTTPVLPTPAATTSTVQPATPVAPMPAATTPTAQPATPVAPMPAATSPTVQPAMSAPTAPVAPASTPETGAPPADLLAKGKIIFEKTAGGVGCAYCHGLDGKGGGTSGSGAPDIRGATEARVRGTLTGGVPLMSFIKSSDEDITAVVAYLQYLNKQP